MGQGHGGREFSIICLIFILGRSLCLVTDDKHPHPQQPGGQDAQLLTENKSTFVDTRYLLATADSPPAHIMVRTEGWRTGPPEVLTRLLDPVEGDKVSPDEYRFRIFIRLETGDERYRWLNEGMWIGSGVRRGLEGGYSAAVSSCTASARCASYSGDYLADLFYSDL